MTIDPLHGIFVLLALLVVYSAIAASAWLIVCGANSVAVRALNAAIAVWRISSRSAPEWSAAGAQAPDGAPDLEATLATLVAEQRLSRNLAARLRRITPVFHQGKWAAYPSNGYWAHRFERLRNREAIGHGEK